MTSLYAVGDLVTYTGPYARHATQCRIVKVMPAEHNRRSYHIKDVLEAFERSVPEESLARTVATADATMFRA
jgi:hypothetical protein